MSWPVRIATLSKGGADALHGVQVQAARSPGRTFFRNGLRRSTALTDVATVTRATAAWGVDQGGNVAAFAAGQPVVTTAGLAVYEARTNLLLWSQNIANAAYAKTNQAVAADVVVAPDGTQTGDSLTRTSTAAAAYMSQSLSPVTAGQPAVFSRIVKAKSTGGRYGLRIQFNYPERADAVFDLNSGAVVGSAGVGTVGAVTAGVVPLSNGWFRVWVATASAPTNTGTSAIEGPTDSGVPVGSWEGITSTLCDAYVWNGDFVVGATSVASIIATTSAAVTRNADVIVEPVNIPPGRDFTVQGVTTAPNNAANIYPTVFELRDAANQNSLAVHFDGSSGDLYAVAKSGGSIANYTGGARDATRSPGTLVRFALSVTSSSIKWSVNGGAVKTLPALENGPFQAALTLLGLGCRVAGVYQLNSTLRDLSITMRAYSDAELQTASDVSLTHDLDFVSQVYQYVGAPYVTPTDLPRTTFTRTTSGTAMTLAGQTLAFAAGVLRVTDAGALFEAGTTQYIARSKRPGGTGWAIYGSPTITPDFAVEADGATWTRIQTADQTGIYISGVTAVVGSMCQSWRLKDNGGASKVVTLGVGGGFFGAGSDRSFSFNLTTGERTLDHADLSATGAVQLADGSWLVWCVFTATSAGPSAAAVTYGRSGAVDFLVSRPQFEPGTYPSSSLVSDGATMTRNADVLASANDPNPAAYTVVAEFTVPPSGSQNGRIWGYDDGTANNRALLYIAAGSNVLQLVVTTAGVEVARISLGAVTPGTSYKVAAAIASNDFAAVITGGSVQTDVSGAVPPCTQFGYGCQPAVGSQFGGVIKRIRRFAARKTNSELQALVA